MRAMALLLALLLAPLASLAQTADAPTVVIEHVWARATPGTGTTGAVYFTLTNKSTTGDRLMSVTTPVAGAAQLHATSTDGIVMRMRPVDALEVKPGTSVTLQPGGLHLMLTDLKAPLKEGQSFPLTLTFEKEGSREVQVSVLKIGAMPTAPMSGHDMSGHDMGGMKH